MATEPVDGRNEAARRFIEPVQDEVVLSSEFEAEFRRRLEDEDYVGALVVAIYFS